MMNWVQTYFSNCGKTSFLNSFSLIFLNSKVFINKRNDWFRLLYCFFFSSSCNRLINDAFLCLWNKRSFLNEGDFFWCCNYWLFQWSANWSFRYFYLGLFCGSNNSLIILSNNTWWYLCSWFISFNSCFFNMNYFWFLNCFLFVFFTIYLYSEWDFFDNFWGNRFFNALDLSWDGLFLCYFSSQRFFIHNFNFFHFFLSNCFLSDFFNVWF